jgi:hypothetical protein
MWHNRGYEFVPGTLCTDSRDYRIYASLETFSYMALAIWSSTQITRFIDVSSQLGIILSHNASLGVTKHHPSLHGSFGVNLELLLPKVTILRQFAHQVVTPLQALLWFAVWKVPKAFSLFHAACFVVENLFSRRTPWAHLATQRFAFCLEFSEFLAFFA